MKRKKKISVAHLIPQEAIESKILLIRGRKVMLDRDLAGLYGVKTKVLNQAVKRNIERFPEDFMFEMSKAEYQSLRYHFGALKRGEHSKYLPFAFTEHGILMLSSILSSKRAIHVNIQIMRTFTKLRELVLTNKELKHAIEKLERKVKDHDTEIQIIFDTINQLLEPPKKPKGKIGFK